LISKYLRLLSSVAVRYLSCPTRYCADGARGVHHILTLADGLPKSGPFRGLASPDPSVLHAWTLCRVSLLPQRLPRQTTTRTTNDHTPSYQNTRVSLCKDHLNPSLASAPLRPLRAWSTRFMHTYLLRKSVHRFRAGWNWRVPFV